MSHHRRLKSDRHFQSHPHFGIAFGVVFFYTSRLGNLMKLKQRVVLGPFHAGVISLLVGWCLAAHAETNTVEATSDDVDWSRHIVEAYKGYQLQQEQTFKMLQQAREEVAVANLNAQKAAQETESRLKLIEESLAAQRERDHTLDNLQEAHRQSLLILTAVAGIAFFCLLLFGLYLMRVLNRRTELLAGAAAMMPARRPLPALATGELQLSPLNPAEQSTARFLAALERLERRLEDMETVPHTGGNGQATGPADADDSNKHLAVLLGKGQTLLNLGKPAEALACFDDALKLDGGHAEAHVKRGTALEKLERLDDAIESFDRAIQLDDSLTMAYLCKGGVFNRLERYSDALKCYEQALRSQEKPAAA